MPNSDKLTITKDELEALIEQRVEKEKLSILISDFKAHKNDEEKQLMRIDTNIAEMFKLIREFPDRITQCRDDLETDIHRELELHYATEPTVATLRKDLETDITLLKSKIAWTVGTIVAVGGALQFGLMVYLFGLKIAALH